MPASRRGSASGPASKAAGRPGAPAVRHRHPLRRAHPADQPGAQPRPRHPAPRRPAGRSQLRRRRLQRRPGSRQRRHRQQQRQGRGGPGLLHAVCRGHRSVQEPRPGDRGVPGLPGGDPDGDRPAGLSHAGPADLLLPPLGRHRRRHGASRRRPHPALPAGLLLPRAFRADGGVRPLLARGAARRRRRRAGARLLAGLDLLGARGRGRALLSCSPW